MTSGRAELDRQVEVLVCRGYPKAAGLTERAFRDLLAPLAALADHLGAAGTGPTPDDDRLGFVLVVAASLVPTDVAMGLVEHGGRPGRVDITGAPALGRFRPIDGLDVPAGPGYLALDVDTGADLRDVAPEAALPRITAADRSPLTIDEGVALLTQQPSVLTQRNAYSLLGSRAGDRRVPAIWTSRRAPRLGWCWAGMPHGWLGSASCAQRLAP